MGLCKCPKRKTTSHFCFHHCVNVCEHCIINNHTTCVVKSYTTWLKEASGSASSSTVSASALCAVCQKQFAIVQKDIENIATSFNNRKTPIRLLCYHIVHAHCLAVYVKKQLKCGNILKCPSCARSLWLQEQQDLPQDSNDITGINSNELSPVASQLHKYLLDHGDWWGQALITNGNVENLEKYLLEDEECFEETADEQFEEQSTFEIKEQFITVPNNISPMTINQTIQSPNNTSGFYSYNNSELVPLSDIATINHRNNTHQTYQPIHHRHFNNNYGIDSVFTPQQQQHYHQQQQQLQQQQQQCLSVNMAITQNSDLSNRHTITSSTPLIINNDEEQQDPSGKYRPKKFNKQSWSLSYHRLSQYFCGLNNRGEDNNTTRISILIIICVIIIVFLLLVITSYTRSSNEPFNNNSIDYAGEDDLNKINDESNLKIYNINL